FPGLLKLSRLRIGGREPKMGRLHIGQARRAFAEQTHRLLVALETVVGHAQPTCRVEERRKWIEAHICLQYLDRSGGFTRKDQGSGVSIVDEIGIERKGSLEFGDGSVVLALENQDVSKLSASLRQAGVEVQRGLCQFKRAIERSGIEIIAIERLGITSEAG